MSTIADLEKELACYTDVVLHWTIMNSPHPSAPTMTAKQAAERCNELHEQIAKKQKPEPKPQPKKKKVVGFVPSMEKGTPDPYYDMSEAEGYAYAYGSVGCERK